jgi:hypothetical protein
MRKTLSEIEKFYIQQHYHAFSVEKLIEKIPGVLPDTIKAFVLNLPSLNQDENATETKEKTVQERHPTSVTTIQGSPNKTGAGELFARREGITIMTPAAAEHSDINNPMS